MTHLLKIGNKHDGVSALTSLKSEIGGPKRAWQRASDQWGLLNELIYRQIKQSVWVFLPILHVLLEAAGSHGQSPLARFEEDEGLGV